MSAASEWSSPIADQLDGQRVLVIGGYGGLGAEISRLLAGGGARVAVAGRDLTKARELAGSLTGAVALTCDVTDPGSVATAVEGAVELLGGVDSVVNCAGALTVTPSMVVDVESVRRTIDSNLVGALTVAQAAARVMARSGGGRIILVSSVRAFSGSRMGFAAYSAAKAGVNQLVRQLSTEWAEHGILVNGVAPGFVETDFVDSPVHDSAFLERVRRRIPLGRMAQPEEIAGAVIYLCSSLSSFVTGQVIVIDGGVTASQ